MTFVIRRFHALFLRPFRTQPESNWTDVKTEPSLAAIAKRRAWPPAAPKPAEDPSVEATLVSARYPSTSEVRSVSGGVAQVRECVIGIDDAEEQTLDRDSSESGPTPALEIGRVHGGPWQDEPALRVDAKTPASGSPFRPSRRYRATASSKRPIHVARAADQDTDETPTCSSFDFPDHSAASGAIWPDDEEQAVLSSRGRNQIAPSPTTPRAAAAPSQPPPRVAYRRDRDRALALTGELPVYSDIERL